MIDFSTATLSQLLLIHGIFNDILQFSPYSHDPQTITDRRILISMIRAIDNELYERGYLL